MIDYVLHSLLDPFIRIAGGMHGAVDHFGQMTGFF